MLIKHNFLRSFRKRSKLTQQDIGFILDLADYAQISRWEQGHRLPSVETLLTYNLLFNIPIEELFERQRREVRESIKPRIDRRLEQLRELKLDHKTLCRIAFLDGALSRLMATNA